MIIPVNLVSAQMDYRGNSPCNYPYGISDTKSANELISCFNDNPNIVNDYEGFAFAVGTAYATLNDNEKSIFYYKLALEQDPENGGTLAMLCYAYLDEKEYAIAYDYASQAVSLGHDDARTTICLDNAERVVKGQENMEKRMAQLEAEEKAKIAQLEAEQKAEQKEKIAQLEAEQKVQEAKIAQLEAEQNGGGCLIATATYGSELAPQVQQLREIRDNKLMNTESGSAFMSGFNELYYTFSPTIADMERESPMFKEAVKLGLTPMLSTLSIMENAESESEVLGLGLSVIALNLGMYIAAPAMMFYGISKKVKSVKLS